jgi:DNA-binding CsgD family transcriptional regulator
MLPPRSVSESREAQVLRLVADVCGLLDISEFRHGLLDALNRALPSKYVSLNEIGPTPDTVAVIVRPELAPEYVERFAEHAHENPLLQRYLQSRDGRAYRFSDVITASELHRLALYRELYKPLGVEHQLAFMLPAAPDRVLGVALSRGRRDYTDSERDVAEHARPFLIQAYQNAIAYELLRSGSPNGSGGALVRALLAAGLTSREAEVLRLVALGRSNQHIAEELGGISPRTVGKHLEHGYRKLGVTDRSSAAARAWELASSTPRTTLSRSNRSDAQPRAPRTPPRSAG